MKTLLVALSFACSTIAVAVSYSDVAEVIDSKPIYKTVQVQKPYQYCYEETIQQGGRSDGSATNELIGGILGGVIGNQFGGGSGKKISTAAGALLGASIANDREKSQYRGGIRTQEVCKTRYRNEDEERFSHYLVRYNYKGMEGNYESSHRPKSKQVNVRISVNVAPERGYVYRDER